MKRLIALVTVVATMLLAPIVVTGPAQATVPGPNGQIAFARQLSGGGADIFIANPDGQHAQQVPLVYTAEDFGIPRWSPDSSQLLPTVRAYATVVSSRWHVIARIPIIAHLLLQCKGIHLTIPDTRDIKRVRYFSG